jgi:hypothetical protein
MPAKLRFRELEEPSEAQVRLTGLPVAVRHRLAVLRLLPSEMDQMSFNSWPSQMTNWQPFDPFDLALSIGGL